MHVKFVLKSAAKRLKYSDSISSFRQNHLCEENQPPTTNVCPFFSICFLVRLCCFFSPLILSSTFYSFVCSFRLFVYVFVYFLYGSKFRWFFFVRLFLCLFVCMIIFFIILLFVYLFTIFYHARSSINTAIWNPIKKYYRINCHIL